MQPEKFSEGSISESMGVNTKPAYRLEIEGHWFLFSPSLTQEQHDHCSKALINAITNPPEAKKIRSTSNGIVLIENPEKVNEIDINKMIEQIPPYYKNVPIEIVPIGKTMIDEKTTFVEEGNKFTKAKVKPRDQRNRERFNRRR